MQNLIALLKKTRKYQLKADGVSMIPLLHPDDVLYFRKIRYNRIKTNDILVLVKNRRIIIHRCIYKNRNYIITKGDNNPNSDGKIFEKNIIGVVYKVKRGNQVFNPDDIYLIQSTRYFHEIVKIKNEFEKVGINYVFLKGLPLHLYFEKTHPRRIYSDCDILIDKKYEDAVFKIFINKGYEYLDNALNNFLKMLKNRNTEWTFVKKIENFYVSFDIHIDAITLINQFGSLDKIYPVKYIEKINSEFLENKKIINIQNETYPILSMPDLILFLLYNYFHHNYQGVFRLEFINSVLNNSYLDTEDHIKKRKYFKLLDFIARRIVEYKLQNFVYPVFIILEKYYRDKFPKQFLKLIKPDVKKVRYIEKYILKTKIFDRDLRIKTGIRLFRNFYFLSPNSSWKKILTFFDVGVIYCVFWVIIFFIRRSFKRAFKSF